MYSSFERFKCFNESQPEKILLILVVAERSKSDKSNICKFLQLLNIFSILFSMEDPLNLDIFNEINDVQLLNI